MPNWVDVLYDNLLSVIDSSNQVSTVPDTILYEHILKISPVEPAGVDFTVLNTSSLQPGAGNIGAVNM